MLLFLLMSIPLGFLAFYVLFFPSRGDIAFLFRPLFRGVLLGIMGLLIQWILSFRFDFIYSLPSIFLYTLLKQGGIAILTVLIVNETIGTLTQKKSQDPLQEMALQYAAIFTVLAFFDVVFAERFMGILEPFILPLTRLSLLFALILLVDRFKNHQSGKKIVFALSSLGAVLLASFIQMLSYYQLIWLQVPLTIIAATAVLYFLSKEWKSRKRHFEK